VPVGENDELDKIFKPKLYLFTFSLKYRVYSYRCDAFFEVKAYPMLLIHKGLMRPIKVNRELICWDYEGF
jgi:hypothetical protein